MGKFAENRRALESEGVLIGGWSVKDVLIRRKRATQDVPIALVEPIENEWTKAEERRLLWKLDLRVLLPCFIVYLLAYIDRGNISNVKILRTGTPDSFEQSLNLQGTQFNWAVSTAFFTATACLMPSTILLKKISAKNLLPLGMLFFGGVVMCMAACKNAAGIIVARFFLGIPESGIIPCCVMYFSFWYRPEERAQRIGFFYSASALSQAISGFMTVGIDQLNGKGGLKSWQWVFIIEGAVPLALAVPVYFLLLSWPETTGGLTERERYIAVNRFGRGAARMTDVTWDTKAFIRLALRPSTYLFFVSYVCLAMVALSLGTFEPTILVSLMHFSVHKANLYAGACNLVLAAITWLWSLHSDITRERMWHLLLLVLASYPCFAVYLWVGSHHDQTSVSLNSMYGLIYLGQLAMAGQPIVASYRSITLYGAAEQAVGIASTTAGLTIAGIIGPQMYPNQDAPYYVAGFKGTLAILSTCVLAYSLLPYVLYREAAHRKKITGHALPLRSIEDAEQAQVSDAVMARIHEANGREQEELNQRMTEKTKTATEQVENV